MRVLVRRSLQALLALGLIAASPPAAASQVEGARATETTGAPRVIEAHRLRNGETVEVDGRLDEAVWTRIPAVTDFRQQEPREGAPPSERTEVRIAVDDRNLYFGIRLLDEDPDGIVAYQRARDAPLDSDDSFAIVLDPFRTGRTGYIFEVNPAGLMGDGLLVRDQGPASIERSWRGIWQASATRDETGWHVEIRIPFRSLSFDPGSAEWGIDFQRVIRRKNEQVVWSGHRRNEGILRPAHAGRLVGLPRDIDAGAGVEVKPYLMGNWRTAGPDAPAPDEDARPYKYGLDLNYDLTPSLRASLTVNTDFAEAEVDDQVVSLDRFPVFLPEQRDFFLEGSDTWDFASNVLTTPFFSRRIGLIEGEEVPIRYGLRLLGTRGPYEIGALRVRTGARGIHSGDTFSVLRLNRSILRESDVGLFYTRRAPDRILEDSPFSVGTNLGADVNLSTSRLFEDRNLFLTAWTSWHTAEHEDVSGFGADRSAFDVVLVYPNDELNYRLSFRRFGEHYDPPVGFTRRRDFHRLQSSAELRPRMPGAHVRRLRFGGRFEYLTNLRHEFETLIHEYTLLGVDLESGDEMTLELVATREHLREPFALHPTVTVPEGDHRFNRGVLSLATATHRRVAVTGELGYGSFWTGEQLRGEVTVLGRIAPGVDLEVLWERNDVWTEEAGFTTDLVRLNGAWNPTPRLSLVTKTQYDDFSGYLGLQSRLRFIVQPGNEIFVVFSRDWLEIEEAGGDRFGQRFVSGSAGLQAKVNYTLRF